MELNNNITWAQTAWVSWRQDARVRTSGRQRALGPQWPTVEQPKPRWERNAAMVRRTWGQYSSLSLSPAHLSHTTNITLSRIKCERYIFIKKCVRSFIEVRHYVWLCSAYICICIMSIQQFWGSSGRLKIIEFQTWTDICHQSFPEKSKLCPINWRLSAVYKEKI